MLVAVFLALAGGFTYMVTSNDGSGPAQSAEPAPPGAAAPARKADGAPKDAGPACSPAPLPQRAGSVLVVGLPEVKSSSDPLVRELVDLGIGGVLLTGGNVVSRNQVTSLVRDLRERSRRPLIVSTDEETGRVSSFAQLFGSSRSARRLAREETPSAVREEARDIGSNLAAMGIDLNLAPVADLDAGPFSGIVGDRSFSAEPAVASRFAMAFAAGMADAKVRSTVKHFPGHGPATGDDHTGRVTADATLAELKAHDLKPFADMIGAGVPVVMMANVDYAALDADLPASLSPKAYELLRRMGFRGVAITDSVGMGAVNQRWDVAEAAVASIKAGADGVLLTDGSMAKHQVRALVEAVRTGELDESRLNEAAARMTALAGGDPVAFACQAVELPALKTS